MSLSKSVPQEASSFPPLIFFFFSVVLLYFWNKKNVRGKVTKAWLGVAGQLFPLASHNYPWWHTDSYCLSFLCQENGQRGERRSGDAFTVFFMTSHWLHLLLPGRVKRKKGPTAEKSCLPNRPIGSKLPNTLIDTIAAKGTCPTPVTFVLFLNSLVTG